MTAPDLRHHTWCTAPHVTRSTDILDRLRTRWRCLGCGVQAVVIGGAEVPERVDWTEARP